MNFLSLLAKEQRDVSKKPILVLPSHTAAPVKYGNSSTPQILFDRTLNGTERTAYGESKILLFRELVKLANGKAIELQDDNWNFDIFKKNLHTASKSQNFTTEKN
uniref:Uncharacterized protein n=1 Tax=Glossina pallidipes TaxID=7398 RepID=A0A1B0AJC7_GLOPL